MARDEQLAMSAERLAEINSLTADVVAGRIHARFDEETAWLAILDARREVERLRAALDAQGKLVELLAAEAWYGSNAPYYAEMRRILETHKRAWHTLSESKQRSGGDGA